jgi:glutamine synthetase
MDTAEKAAQRLDEYRSRGCQRVKVVFTDVDGVLRGKYLSLAKFSKLLETGGGWCDCVFGWDLDDVLYELPGEAGYSGWHRGFPDVPFRLRVETERWLEDEHCPQFLAQFEPAEAGDAPPPCPRRLLEQALGALAQCGPGGLTLRSGFEYEFFVFDETARSVRDKGHRELVPLTPGNFGYSALRTATHAELFGDLMSEAEALRCPLEGLHTETGPGVWEAALAPADGLEGADRAALFKTFAKSYFARRQLIATFMAKWSMAVPGQSGHFHCSLIGGDGSNRFSAPDAEHGMSELQRQALAGVLKYLPQWLVMLAPTINSYTRLVPGAWAPTAATWGVENRTAAVRLIPGGEGQRLEVRVPGADSNPYLVAAAMAAAMRLGIEQALTPPAPVTGNAYAITESLPAQMQFPATLREATARFAACEAARAAFGDGWVDHFARTRDWESREYERHVNDWQLGRYFELI